MMGVGHVEEKLLESGDFRGRTNILTTPNAMVSNFDISRKVLQLGTGVPGHITFGIWEPTVQFTWRKVEMDTDMIGILWKKEHRSVSASGFKAIPISIEENFFMERCRSIGRPDLIDMLLKSEVLKVPEDKLRSLRRLLMLAVYCVELDDLAIIQMIEGDAVDLLIDSLLETVPDPVVKDRTSHRFETVVDHIHNNIAEITTVQQICNGTKIPERTLRRLIQDRYDISPKIYLNALRLNEVRKELKKGAEATTVNYTAGLYNFWHMGQFTRDYKHLFGELPSETLTTTGVIR